MTGDWRRHANKVIDAVLLELPADLPVKEKRKALNAAYPFGPRQNHPYRIWCSAVRIALAIEKPKRNRKAVESGPDLFSQEGES